MLDFADGESLRLTLLDFEDGESLRLTVLDCHLTGELSLRLPLSSRH